MPDQKISEFTTQSPASGDLVTGLQSGVNANFTTDSISLYQKKITLTSAEILDLYTTPKTLVAAPGAGKFIRPISIFYKLTYNSAAYTTNTQLVVKNGTLSFLTNTTVLIATSDYSGVYMASSAQLGGTADFIDTPLILTTNAGNPAAGNSAVDVYISYEVITI